MFVMLFAKGWRKIRMSKKIPLTRNLFAKVDTEDYEELIKYNWRANDGRNGFYAIRNVLKKILDYCLVKRELHWKTHKQFEKYKNRLIIPSIVITTLASLLTFSITIIGDVKWIILVSGSLTGISSLFQTLANTYEFSKKSDAHELASEAYDQLITKIRFELLLMKCSWPIFIAILLTAIQCITAWPPAVRREYDQPCPGG